jgi:hypothetical protein
MALNRGERHVVCEFRIIFVLGNEWKYIARASSPL